jgi:hypothetical protein
MASRELGVCTFTCLSVVVFVLCCWDFVVGYNPHMRVDRLILRPPTTCNVHCRSELKVDDVHFA